MSIENSYTPKYCNYFILLSILFALFKTIHIPKINNKKQDLFAGKHSTTTTTTKQYKYLQGTGTLVTRKKKKWAQQKESDSHNLVSLTEYCGGTYIHDWAITTVYVSSLFVLLYYI